MPGHEQRVAPVQNPFEPARRPQAPPGSPPPAAGPDAAPGADPAIRMTQVTFGFTIPGGLKLAELDGADCLTRAPTRVSVTATATGLRFVMSPPIFVDAPWPAENVQVHSASYNYGGGVSVSTRSGEGWGWFDVSDEVHSAISSLIMNAVTGTPMSRSGYNPFTDANVGETLSQVGSRAATGGASGGSATSGAAPGGVSPEQLTQVGGGASMTVDAGFVFRSDAGGVQVPAGTTITVAAQGQGTMAQLGAAQDDRQRGAALALDGITIQSSGITLLKGTSPIARITGLRIERGGNVVITEMQPLGAAGDLAAVESMFRLFGGAMGLAAQGAPEPLAVELAARNSQAELIPGVTQALIENALTPAVQSMVRQHSASMPGLDLGSALGIAPEDAGPPQRPGAAPPDPVPRTGAPPAR
jgi:hypothetical protein